MLHDACSRTRADGRTGLDESMENDITKRSPLIQHKQPEADFETLLNENLEMVSVLEICEERHTSVDCCEQPKRSDDECADARNAAGRDGFKLIEDLVEDVQIHGSPQF